MNNQEKPKTETPMTETDESERDSAVEPYRKMNIQNPTNQFLKLKEVQHLLGVSRTTLWRWYTERGLPVVTIGNVTRVRESDFQQFVERHVKGLPVAN